MGKYWGEKWYSKNSCVLNFKLINLRSNAKKPENTDLKRVMNFIEKFIKEFNF